MKQKTAIVFVLSLCLSCGASIAAAEKTDPAVSGAANVILPSSRDMVGSIAHVITAQKISELVGSTGNAAYGFSTDISKEVGSFKLGVLLADLEASVRAGHVDRVLDACSALAEGLVHLGAEVEMVVATMNLRAAVYNKVDLAAIDKASIPIIRPFIEAFVAKHGDVLYMRLGEWVEGTRFIAAVGSTSEDTAAAFKSTAGLAAQFSIQLQGRDGVPQGTMTQLQAMQEIAAKETLSERDYVAAMKILRKLKSLIG